MILPVCPHEEGVCDVPGEEESALRLALPLYLEDVEVVLLQWFPMRQIVAIGGMHGQLDLFPDWTIPVGSTHGSMVGDEK